MTMSATPRIVNFHGDASLLALLDALSPHGDKALVIEYGGRTTRPGYHVTEVKAGTFHTLDCGGNPDSWQETILQVEDLAPADLAPGGESSFMRVGKFRGILDKVAGRIALDPDARVTLEVGPPAEAMQVFDLDALFIEADRVRLTLAARPAICKPRHRYTVPAGPVKAADAAPCCGGGARQPVCC
jgi:hypothetical protein